jgi:hypothetical protein
VEPPEPGSDIEEFEFPPKEEAKAAPPAPKPSAPKDEGEIPQRILESKRFIEVMTFLMQKHKLSVEDRDAVLSACEALKEKIPVLRRKRDLAESVDACLLTMQESASA